ncbi:MAG: hypothetical protein ACRDTX_22370 [Pseudonocardiaceae bacterium]
MYYALADSALDAADDLRVLELLPNAVLGGALEGRQDLVMRGAVQRYLGEFDDAVLRVQPRVRAEGSAEILGAEFRHHHSGHRASGKTDADAYFVVVEDGVVAGVDVGRAVVLDTQQNKRRIDQRATVFPLQLLQGAGVLGVDLGGGGRVHLYAVSEPLAANEDELIQEGKGRYDDTEDRESDVPPKVSHNRLPGEQFRHWVGKHTRHTSTYRRQASYADDLSASVHLPFNVSCSGAPFTAEPGAC